MFKHCELTRNNLSPQDARKTPPPQKTFEKRTCLNFVVHVILSDLPNHVMGLLCNILGNIKWLSLRLSFNLFWSVPREAQ